MRKERIFILGSLLVVYLLTFCGGLAVQAKRVIHDEGQAKLMQEVNAGQKAKKLTVDEAHKLRKDLARTARKKAKMLRNVDRTLKAEDSERLKGDLADIRARMLKLEREKI